MGSIAELLGMIPGVKKMIRGADMGDAEGELKRVEAIIDSMTKRGASATSGHPERQPAQTRIARRQRPSVADVNRLLKPFAEAKKVRRSSARGPMTQGQPPGLAR